MLKLKILATIMVAGMLAACSSQAASSQQTPDEALRPLLGMTCSGFIGVNNPDKGWTRGVAALKPRLVEGKMALEVRGDDAPDSIKMVPEWDHLTPRGVRTALGIYAGDGSIFYVAPHGQRIYFFVKYGPEGPYLYGKMWGQQGTAGFTFPCRKEE